jgi:peptide/nickel transport system substrate-binding protein
MRRTKVQPIAVGVVALAILASSASHGYAGTTPPSPPTSEADGTSPASSSPDAPEFDPEATLTFAVGFDPPGLDVHVTQHTGPNTAYIVPVYDALVGVTPEGEPVPQLATEWEVLSDGNAIQFQLRDDVVFHDMEPFNADAVPRQLRALSGSPRVDHRKRDRPIDRGG